MNRRETLALHRLGVMRLRARAAAHQRRLAALADASHQQQLDNCPCQTCSLRRTLTQPLFPPGNCKPPHDRKATDMRAIDSHKVNPANDTLTLQTLDEPGHGGANHKYLIGGFPAGPTLIQFQDGPISADGNGVNGVTHEVLLAIVADRLRGFQSGPYSCKANACALTHIEEAMHWLQQRTLERMRRGVEGTHTV